MDVCQKHRKEDCGATVMDVCQKHRKEDCGGRVARSVSALVRRKAIVPGTKTAGS